MPRPQLKNLELELGTSRVCDPASRLPEQAKPLPQPTLYIKIHINTTREINLQMRYFTMTYLVVVRGLTNFDVVLIESTSFMDEF